METADAYTIKTRADLEDALRDLSDLNAKLRLQQAEREMAVRRVARPYDQTIEVLEEDIREIEETTTAYARAHRDELLEGSDGKTAMLRSGTIEYRQGREHVVLTQEEDAVILRLKGLGLHSFVRKKESLDKREIRRRWEEAQNVAGLLLERAADTITINPA